MLKVTCPRCHASVDAKISDGQLIVGQHTDDRGGDCDGWGESLEIPDGLSLESGSSTGRDGLSGFNDL